MGEEAVAESNGHGFNTQDPHGANRGPASTRSYMTSICTLCQVHIFVCFCALYPLLFLITGNFINKYDRENHLITKSLYEEPLMIGMKMFW